MGAVIIACLTIFRSPLSPANLSGLFVKNRQKSGICQCTQFFRNNLFHSPPELGVAVISKSPDLRILFPSWRTRIEFWICSMTWSRVITLTQMHSPYACAIRLTLKGQYRFRLIPPYGSQDELTGVIRSRYSCTSRDYNEFTAIRFRPGRLFKVRQGFEGISRNSEKELRQTEIRISSCKLRGGNGMRNPDGNDSVYLHSPI